MLRRGHCVFLVQFCRAFYRGGSARKWCCFGCAGAFVYNGLENTSCILMRWMYNYGNYAESKFLAPYGVEILIALCCYKIRPAPASGRPRAGRPPVAETSAAWAALALYYVLLLDIIYISIAISYLCWIGGLIQSTHPSDITQRLDIQLLPC